MEGNHLTEDGSIDSSNPIGKKGGGSKVEAGWLIAQRSEINGQGETGLSDRYTYMVSGMRTEH